MNKLFQICPYGQYENRNEAGAVTRQLCDREAFHNVVAAFDSPVLVDFDHNSEDGSTEAAGWIEALSVDDSGLVAEVKWTDSGLAAIENRRYRFVSPVWHTDNSGRPVKLLRVGLTNRPQIPVKPLINAVQTAQTKENIHMEKLAELLGLDPAASVDDIANAVAALKTRISELENEAADREADAFAAENAEVADGEVLKNAFRAAPDATTALVNSIKAAKKEKPGNAPDLPAAPLLNSAVGVPGIPAAVNPLKLRQTLAALPPSERLEFWQKHKTEL